MIPDHPKQALDQRFHAQIAPSARFLRRQWNTAHVSPQHEPATLIVRHVRKLEKDETSAYKDLLANLRVLVHA